MAAAAQSWLPARNNDMSTALNDISMLVWTVNTAAISSGVLTISKATAILPFVEAFAIKQVW